MKIHEDKDVNIEWVSSTSLNFIQPRSGEKVMVTFQDIAEFAEVFSSRAEEILQQLGVPQLTDEQLQSVKDPLGTKGALKIGGEIPDTGLFSGSKFSGRSPFFGFWFCRGMWYLLPDTIVAHGKGNFI